MALINKLSAIGDAIREKSGTTALMTLDEMPDAIAAIETGGGDIEIEPIELTGNQDYGCAGSLAITCVNLFGDKITTKDITNSVYMFQNYTLEEIPFDLNYKSGANAALDYMFKNAKNLKKLPAINNVRIYSLNALFTGCHALKEIPNDYFDGWDFGYLTTTTSSYAGNASVLFTYCYNLRSLPVDWFKNLNPYTNYSYSYFPSAFTYCYSLDELVNLPIPYTKTAWTSNAFNATVTNCYRLKRLTFATQEDGSPIVVQWKSQIIDLTMNVGFESAVSGTAREDSETWNESTVGFVVSDSVLLRNNKEITADKMIYNAATYALLKDDPDAFCMTSNVTNKGAYSRYNKISAIETINSLPDTSAYLATAGGTNTIKFLGNSGKSTDGGAINTMTEEEIAVAAAKGWTITLT